MGLELLTQADYVLNACGRPVPPKGFRFVDLPKIIPFHATLTTTPGTSATILNEDAEGLLFTALAQGTSVDVGIQQIGSAPLSYAITGDTAAGWEILFTYPVSGGVLCSAVIALIAATPALSALISASIVIADSPLPNGGTGPLFGPSILGINTQFRIENISNTLFLCRGIMLNSDPLSIRIKWPSGRYWNQFPSNDPNATGGAGTNFPQGTGGSLYALDEEMPIERGARVAVELSGVYSGPADVALWGVLRYLIKDTGNILGAVDGKTCIVGYPAQAQSQTAPICLVGYPVSGGAKGKAGSFLMTDPVEALKERQRFVCWPNGNIFAPEFLLGNQCETNTPPGFYDESYTFLSDPVALAGSGQSYNNTVGVPGQDDVVIRRWRAIATPTVITYIGIRSPSGYSLTGGDLIPTNVGYWFPVFPTLLLKHGTLLVLDYMASVGPNFTIQIEFDAAKRRRIS